MKLKLDAIIAYTAMVAIVAGGSCLVWILLDNAYDRGYDAGIPK